MSPRVDYDERQYAVYAAGRALAPEAMRSWIDAFSRHLPSQQPLTILDVGSGTGRFARPLATDLGADVVGIEPSRRMREVADSLNSHPRVRYVEGAAERIPLPAESCDAALLSDALHHIEDRELAVREIGRVLRPDGVLLIRGVRAERQQELLHFKFFPEALPIALNGALSTDEVRELFALGGFEFVAHEIVDQQIAESLRGYALRIKQRAISYLELLEDAEFEKGARLLEAEAERESARTPVIEGIDLVVLRRPLKPSG